MIYHLDFQRRKLSLSIRRNLQRFAEQLAAHPFLSDAMPLDFVVQDSGEWPYQIITPAKTPWISGSSP
jgi:hypothetical protein